jgi:hypothetical protein
MFSRHFEENKANWKLEHKREILGIQHTDTTLEHKKSKLEHTSA